MKRKTIDEIAEEAVRWAARIETSVHIALCVFGFAVGTLSVVILSRVTSINLGTNMECADTKERPDESDIGVVVPHVGRWPGEDEIGIEWVGFPMVAKSITERFTFPPKFQIGLKADGTVVWRGPKVPTTRDKIYIEGLYIPCEGLGVCRGHAK